jgi:hypothetical protein
MNAWLDVLLESAASVWEMPAEEWIDDSPRLTDTELLDREASGGDQIDTRNLRAEMVTAWRAGQANLYVRELPSRTRVVMLGTEEQFKAVPWAFWSRIFQAIGYPVGYVLLYASPEKREFPAAGEAAGAEHINGGYSFLCKQSLVVVYRFEEATRVLLHELLHTACFDKEKAVEHLEANTEAWTEVFLCGLLAKGNRTVFMRLWKKQCRWMEEQAVRLRDEHGVEGKEDYTWRYITGKLRVLEAHGFFADCGKAEVANLSMRMTTPEWDSLMK